jgi:hypothetical protein
VKVLRRWPITSYVLSLLLVSFLIFWGTVALIRSGMPAWAPLALMVALSLVFTVSADLLRRKS